MPLKQVKSHSNNTQDASNAHNIGTHGISSPAVMPFQRPPNTVTQLVIEGALPVKIYRKKGGSNAQRINDRLETYNEARKSDSLTAEQLLEQLSEIENDVSVYSNHKQKGKAAQNLLIEINREKRELSNIIFREEKEKGGEHMRELLEGEKKIETIDHAPFKKGPGAKAGFELEWNNVMWLDSNTDQDFMHQLLSHPHKGKEKYERLGVKLAQNFKKRPHFFYPREKHGKDKPIVLFPRAPILK